MNAVVTGAGSGIGRDVVQRFVAKGVHVYALGRRLDALEETASSTADPSLVTCLSADVTDLNRMRAALGVVESVDFLVANAGICKQSRIDDPDADAVWKEVMSINVDGVWNSFRAVESKLAKGASCVVVSSGLGKNGRPGYTAYTASKHAVLGMVKCFAMELAPRDVRVNAVCPGWVDTSMAQADLVRTAQEHGSTPEAEYQDAIQSIAMKRFVAPDEVAALIHFLCGVDSSGITGQSYNISCGEFFG